MLTPSVHGHPPYPPQRGSLNFREGIPNLEHQQQQHHHHYPHSHPHDSSVLGREPLRASDVQLPHVVSGSGGAPPPAMPGNSSRLLTPPHPHQQQHQHHHHHHHHNHLLHGVNSAALSPSPLLPPQGRPIAGHPSPPPGFGGGRHVAAPAAGGSPPHPAGVMQSSGLLQHPHPHPHPQQPPGPTGAQLDPTKPAWGGAAGGSPQRLTDPLLGAAPHDTEDAQRWALNEVPSPPRLRPVEKLLRALMWACILVLLCLILRESACDDDTQRPPGEKDDCERIADDHRYAYLAVVCLLVVVLALQALKPSEGWLAGKETKAMASEHKARLLEVKRAHFARLRGIFCGVAQQGGAAAALRNGVGARPDRFEPRIDWAGMGGVVAQSFFGDAMRATHFELSPFFLNSASYGAVPKCVTDAAEQWDRRIQQNPVAFHRFTLQARLENVVGRLSALINSDPEETVLLTNANQATSIVLKALPWVVGDRLFILSVDYDATKLACNYLERVHGVDVVEHDLPLPQSHADILRSVEVRLAELKEDGGGMPKLANFCHVTSKTAWIFPAKELTALFHSYGIPVMIDGAQAAGHLDINVRDIGAEWYLGTVHKWMYSCQGVAFLCTQRSKMGCTFPLDITDYVMAGLKQDFHDSYHAHLDFATWLSVTTAFDFVENICGGWGAVRGYCRKQAAQCVAVMKQKWGTDPVQERPEYYGNMPIIPLPNGDGATALEAAKVMAYLSKHSITAFLLVATFKGTPKLCVRCSCQIYTSLEDWTELADTVAALKGRYGALDVVAGIIGGKGGKKKKNPKLDTQFS